MTGVGPPCSQCVTSQASIAIRPSIPPVNLMDEAHFDRAVRGVAGLVVRRVEKDHQRFRAAADLAPLAGCDAVDVLDVHRLRAESLPAAPRLAPVGGGALRGNVG